MDQATIKHQSQYLRKILQKVGRYMTKKTKTIGVIGLGSIGSRHATNLWKELGQTEVIGYDPDPSKHKGWTCGDLDFLLKMADIVVIASPTPDHYQHILACSHGSKKIFVEKPIADQQWQLDNLKNYRTAMESFVGYNLRFHSCVKKAKEWLDAGMIGKPLWANFTLAQHSEKPPYLRDGVILNWSHEIDLATYLLGRGDVACSSTRLSDGRDDLTDILLTHDSGCRSVVHLDYITQPEIRQFLIVGTGATIIVDLLHRMAWLRRADDVIIDQFQGQDTWGENYVEEMQAFLDRCDGKETIGCTGEEGLKVLEICLKVREQVGL
jgi:predicted dehydrogenase